MSTFPLRAIVIEDQVFQRSIAVNMLRQLGCKEVFGAADGIQALAILSQVGPVDVALCEFRLEGMDSLAFLQKIGSLKLVKSILISSSISADLRRTVRQIISLYGLAMLGSVNKPLQYDSLGSLLKKYSTTSVTETFHEPAVELPSESEVRDALAANEFSAYFQPKFHLKTGKVDSVEVLARWEHPSKGLLGPSFFLPIMERYNLLDELLFEQMRQSLGLQGLARGRGHELNIAFNLHAAQLANDDLASRVKGMLAQHGLPGTGLTFELTESGLLEAPTTNLENFVRLRMMGCSLSLDDFGSGYSSLQRLCQLPFNEIKLDAEFVRLLQHEPRSQAVISSTLALGKVLGMSVVVEGIETEEQRLKLWALGCTQGQGYLCARPMSGYDLLQWLDNRRGHTEATYFSDPDQTK